MAGNWIIGDDNNAVILNNQARPVDVLAWCWGELVAMRSVLRMLTVSDTDIDPNVLYEVVGHHMAPLPEILSAAIDRLISDAKQEGDAP